MNLNLTIRPMKIYNWNVVFSRHTRLASEKFQLVEWIWLRKGRSRGSYQFRKLKEIHRNLGHWKEPVIFYNFRIIIRSFFKHAYRKRDFFILTFCVPAMQWGRYYFYLKLIYIVCMCSLVKINLFASPWQLSMKIWVYANHRSSFYTLVFHQCSKRP